MLASGANTGSPIYVIDMETGERRVADLDELEALQGGVVGASTAHDHFESKADRERVSHRAGEDSVC